MITLFGKKVDEDLVNLSYLIYNATPIQFGPMTHCFPSSGRLPQPAQLARGGLLPGAAVERLFLLHARGRRRHHHVPRLPQQAEGGCADGKESKEWGLIQRKALLLGGREKANIFIVD